MSPRSPLVGVFDSGVGGLSVLKTLHQALPHTDLLYVADSGHAPYGERSDDYITARTHRVASHLLAEGAQLLVIACNTATAVAVASLRARWPELPIVAVEPGIKPAVTLTRNGRIGVMATPATLRSDKFSRLLSAHGTGIAVHLQPCPGLAGQIEHGDPEAPPLLALVDQFSQPLKQAGVDTVVLGCTHYPFVAPLIADTLPSNVMLIDTAEAVARQTAAVLDTAHRAAVGATAPPAPPQLFTTGSTVTIERVARHWLPFDCTIGALQLG